MLDTRAITSIAVEASDFTVDTYDIDEALRDGPLAVGILWYKERSPRDGTGRGIIELSLPTGSVTLAGPAAETRRAATDARDALASAGVPTTIATL